MAKIFPDSNHRKVIFASHAEEQVYQLTRKLSKQWQVYYSCTLSSLEPGKGLVDNEIDFVLYHPRWGLFVIEVKGGQIKYESETGDFFTVNRFGKSFRIRNPFQQALVWKSRFIRYLKRQHIKCPATHLVCFPTVQEEDIQGSSEVETRLLLGRSRMGFLEEYLKEIAMEVHPAKFLDFEDVGSKLDKVLRGSSYQTRLYLRDYLDHHELRVKDVEVIHETLVTPISGSQRLAIEGEAGTGKTMLAILLARHFRSLGKNVLLLSSNPLLNDFLIEELGETIDVLTYSELASSYGIELLRRPQGFDGSRNDWIQYEGPERLKKAIQSSDKRYDVLLCDEAQDVQPFWWETIEEVLRDEDSNFYIFFDRSQGVFGSGSADTSFVPEDVLPIDTPYFPLVHNYRTTREICSFSRCFRTGKEILRSHSGRIGYIPELIVYENEEDAQKKLGLLLDRLLKNEGLKSKELTVLSGRKPFNSGSFLPADQKLGAYDLVDLGAVKRKSKLDLGSLEEKIPVSTIAGFKGLETQVGIITNISEYNLPLSNPIMSSLLYVASTRAKHMLYIMVRKGDAKEQVIRNAIKTIEDTGSMIVSTDSFSNELIGEITYYNPDRFGWLRVQDSTYEQSNVMFFPADIKQSQLDHVGVGSKVKFIPRQDGSLTIAADLKAT